MPTMEKCRRGRGGLGAGKSQVGPHSKVNPLLFNYRRPFQHLRMD